MTKQVENILAELKKRIEASGFKSIVITMKINGDRIRITPCGFSQILNWNNIEYYMLDSDKLNLCGSEDLEKIAETLSRYSDLINQRTEEISRLKETVRKHGLASDWSFISDWYKDLYGFRPRVGPEEMVAWANSNDKSSAKEHTRNKAR